MVLINTTKGDVLYQSCGIEKKQVSYSDVVEHNRAMVASPYKEWYNTLFWYGFANKGTEAIDWLLNIKYKASKLKRLYYKIVVFYLRKFR